MYELVQVTDRDYYIESPAKIGVVRTAEDEVCLIDAGNDQSAGKKVRRILDEHGWRLRAIYNTHSHADHIGGNRYLENCYGCSIYAPGIECAATLHPVLEPTLLFGGFAPKELRHKFLMAKESHAKALTPDVLPDGFEVLPLPGHSFDMVGFRTPDDTVYLADCLSSAETLEKYRIGFVFDVGAYLETLEKVKKMEAKAFVPAHAAATADIYDLAQLNINAVHEIADRICETCCEPRCFDDILRQLFSAYGLTMTFEQHALVGSTVRSYLAWLHDTGRVSALIEDNRLLWQRA